MCLETFLDVFEPQRRVSQEAEFGPPEDRKKYKEQSEFLSYFWSLLVCVSLGEASVLLTLSPPLQRFQVRPPLRWTWT